MTAMNKGGYVYIMSAPDRTALYTGATSDLAGRIWKHKAKYYPNSFSTKYNCVMLVYYCAFGTIDLAIAEEKRIKGGSRKQKIDLIYSMNPEWVDLWETII
jgi:putative endonuclease